MLLGDIYGTRGICLPDTDSSSELWFAQGLSMAIEETRACAKLGDAAMIYWNRAAFHYFDQLAVLDAVELAPGHFTLAYKDELKAIVYRMLYRALYCSL